MNCTYSETRRTDASVGNSLIFVAYDVDARAIIHTLDALAALGVFDAEWDLCITLTLSILAIPFEKK